MIASCALVAGYVEVEDQAFISGGVVVHQFSKIGRLAMIGGNTRVNSDVPPFFLYSDFNVAAKGLNVVGLKRAGFSTATDLAALKKAYQLLYRSGLKLEDALARIETEIDSPQTRHLVAFIRTQPARHLPRVNSVSARATRRVPKDRDAARPVCDLAA